jgi:hypothetical protein
MASPFGKRTVVPLIYSVSLLALLLVAAAARFRLPQTPLFDPDYGGYLRPALSMLTGHGFPHIGGRDCLYPGFIFIVLKIAGDFRAISVVQHVLGLATGALMIVACQRGVLLLRHPFGSPRVPSLVSFLGLLPAAAYLSAPSAIFFEQSIRPEAIFPFFAVLSICLNIEFIHCRWIIKTPARAAWLGAAQMVVSVIAYKLKPSFGFALILVNLPIAASLLTSGMTIRLKALMTTGAAVFCALFLLWPESVLKRSDPDAYTFLPETLLTIHADMIRDQMAADLANNLSGPFPRQDVQTLLDHLNAELPAARLPQNRPYPSLGFNPDYLLYTDPVFRGVTSRKHDAFRERAELGYYYYERTFLHRPARMLGKVWGQMRIFYHFGAADREQLFGKGFRLRNARANLRAEYQRNIDLYDEPGAAARFDEYPPARPFIETSRRLSRAPAIVEQEPILTFVQRILEVLYLPGLLVVLLISGWAACTGRLHSGWLTPISVTLLVLSYNLGNNLTVAVVHSLDVRRYIDNELAYTLLGSTFSLLLIGETTRRLAGGWFVGHMDTMDGAEFRASALPLPALPAPGDGNLITPSLCILMYGVSESGYTAAFVADYRSTFPNARLVALDDPGVGRREAMLTALAGADSDAVILVKASESYPAEGARRLFESYCAQPADLIVGAREGVAGPGPASRIVGWMCGWDAADLFCGLRLFSRRFHENVPILARGFELELELTLQALGNGFGIREVPVPFTPAAKGARPGATTDRDARRLVRLFLTLCRDFRPMLCGGILAGTFFLLGLCAGLASILGSHAAGRHATRGPWELPAAVLFVLAAFALQTGWILEAAVQRSREATQLRVRDWMRKNCSPGAKTGL